MNRTVAAPGGNLTFEDNSGTQTLSQVTIPIGTIWQYAGSTAPAGWLLCNGASVSQTTYSALYAVIGTSYGNPGGGNFNLPNFADKFSRGAGTESRGATGGAECLASHNHQISHTIKSSQHSHYISGILASCTLSISHLPSHTHSYNHHHGTFSTANNSQSHNHLSANNLDYYVLDGRYGCYQGGSSCKSGGGHPFSALTTTTQKSNHQHTITIASYSGYLGYSLCDTPVAHTHSSAMSVVGGAINVIGTTYSCANLEILPPYQVLNFIIRY